MATSAKLILILTTDSEENMFKVYKFSVTPPGGHVLDGSNSLKLFL